MFKMTNSADALIAFWDGSSPGIKNMIEYANKKGIKAAVIQYKPAAYQKKYM